MFLRHPLMRVPLVSLCTGLVLWMVGKAVQVLLYDVLYYLNYEVSYTVSAVVMTVAAAAALLLCGFLFFRDMTQRQTLYSALIVCGYSFVEAVVVIFRNQLVYRDLISMEVWFVLLRMTSWMVVPVQMYVSLVSLPMRGISFLMGGAFAAQLVAYLIQVALPLLFCLFARKKDAPALGRPEPWERR